MREPMEGHLMRIMTRRRRERADAARREELQNHYDRFVATFGPAAELTDQQLAALTELCSELADVWRPTVAAELLRGRTWDYRDEDALDEDDPRVRRIVTLAASGGC